MDSFINSDCADAISCIPSIPTVSNPVGERVSFVNLNGFFSNILISHCDCSCGSNVTENKAVSV